MNDAVLVPYIGAAVNGSLNATYQIFDIGSPYPFGITLGSDTNYAGEKPSGPLQAMVTMVLSICHKSRIQSTQADSLPNP